MPLTVDEGFLKIVLFLTNGSNLRITEEWSGGELNEYSYYWLNERNELIIGWDNVPHYKKIENFPHHKHIGKQKTRVPSYETTLEEVMEIIEKEITG